MVFWNKGEINVFAQSTVMNLNPYDITKNISFWEHIFFYEIPFIQNIWIETQNIRNEIW